MSQWWTKQLDLSFVALSWYVQPSILKPLLVISNNKTLYSLDKNGYFILFENHKKPQNLFTVKEIWVLWFKSLPQSSIGPNPSRLHSVYNFFDSKKYWTTKSNIIYPKNFTSRFPEYFNPFFLHSAKIRLIWILQVFSGLQPSVNLQPWRIVQIEGMKELPENEHEQHQWLGVMKYPQEAIIFNLHKINIFDKILVSVCDVKMRLSMS